MAQLSFTGSPHGGSQKHLPEWQNSPRITPTTIIDHSIVGSGAGAFAMFRDTSSLESHFIVLGRRSGTDDGYIWQLVDTDHEADANLNANRYAISIETEDDGDPDRQPWTAAQLRSLAWLHDELRRVHPTIPRRESRGCSDPGGLGYHTLHGAPSCWTPVSKSCPGTVRKGQWRATLLPAFLTGATTTQEWYMSIPETELDKIRRVVWEALNNPPPTDIAAKGGSVANRVAYLNPKMDTSLANQQAGLENQQVALEAQVFVAVLPDIAAGGGGEAMTDEQAAEVARAIAGQLAEAGLPDAVVAALVRELTD